MPLTVTKIEGDVVTCGAWQFDLDCGIEIDDELQWGPKWGQTGSYLEELV